MSWLQRYVARINSTPLDTKREPPTLLDKYLNDVADNTQPRRAQTKSLRRYNYTRRKL